MRTMTVVAILAALALVISGVWAEPAEETVLYGTYEDVPSVGWWPAGASGVIAVNGVEFFEIPDNGGGLPLAIRCEIVDARITEIMSAGIYGPAYVGAVRGQPTVYVGTYRLITAYDEDAVNAGVCCAECLAQQWAQGVAEGLPRVVPTNYAPRASLVETATNP
jgi:hypothetical protein